MAAWDLASVRRVRHLRRFGVGTTTRSLNTRPAGAKGSPCPPAIRSMVLDVTDNQLLSIVGFPDATLLPAFGLAGARLRLPG